MTRKRFPFEEGGSGVFLLFGKRLRYFMEELDMIKEENLSLRSEIAFFREIYSQEREERKQLNELILKQTGFLSSPTPLSLENFSPIGRSNTKWPELRSKLEKKFSKTQTPEQAQVEKNWQDKANQSAKEVGELIQEKENVS